MSVKIPPHKKDTIYSEQIDATAKLNEALKIANDAYMKNLKFDITILNNIHESIIEIKLDIF